MTWLYEKHEYYNNGPLLNGCGKWKKGISIEVKLSNIKVLHEHWLSYGII